MSDVTLILTQIERGDPQAAEKLLPLVYDELRRLAAAKLAHETPGQTLQATALVHEAYLRLSGGDARESFGGRRHFFLAAAEAMRRILVDRARSKGRQKRGGDLERLELGDVEILISEPSDELLAVDEALSRFAEKHPEKAELVKLRFYVGMNGEEAAQSLGISPSTADRHWTFARAWLLRELSREDSG